MLLLASLSLYLSLLYSLRPLFSYVGEGFWLWVGRLPLWVCNGMPKTYHLMTLALN